jgi:hypothetical protein
MKLIGVIYELFQSDFSCIQGHENDDSHIIDREVCLVTDEGRLYVSWCGEPSQYCIGYKRDRWFNNEPEVAINASEWRMWATLVDHEFSLSFTDPSHEILELTSNAGVVYFSAEERGVFGADVCHISIGCPTKRT